MLMHYVLFLQQRHIMNIWQVWKHGLALTTDGYRQLVFINRFLKPIVIKACHNLGYVLSASERKKILFYYPMYTVLACGQMYISMKGRRLTYDETKRLTLVGAMATICDDLIDEDNWTRAQIFELLSQYAGNQSLSTKARLLLHLNDQLKTFFPITDKYLKQLKIALEWQAVSGKQSNTDITLKEIVEICRAKNGNTSLMFATLINEEWTADELAVIYQSAIVGQLTNDSFDVYFDTQSGIKTYINSAENIAAARQFFLDEVAKLHKMIRSVHTAPENKIKTIRRMCILHAFTLTALDHLQHTETKYGLPINWHTIPRAEMVTDMAKNHNRLLTLRYMKWLPEL